MFINTLIVSMVLAVIMVIPMLLKSWLDPDSKSENADAEKNRTSDSQNLGCASCGIKNIAHCSLDN